MRILEALLAIGVQVVSGALSPNAGQDRRRGDPGGQCLAFGNISASQVLMCRNQMPWLQGSSLPWRRWEDPVRAHRKPPCSLQAAILNREGCARKSQCTMVWRFASINQVPVFSNPKSLLVSSSHHNRIQKTVWLKQQKFISHSFGGWTCEIRVPVDLVSGEGCFLNHRWHLLGVFVHGGGCTGSLGLSDKGTNPIDGGPTLTTSSPSKCPLHTITLGVSISTQEF